MSAASSSKQRQEKAHEDKKAPTHLLRHMIKEDAPDAPDAALRCVFCASTPFLFAIVMLQSDYALCHG
jgi:hypothetical protein